MWAQGNLYFSDGAVQPLFIAGLYAAHRVAQGSRRWSVALVVLVLAMVSVDWIGLFFAAAVCLWLLRRWRQRAALATALGVVVAAASAIALYLWQLSLIDGWGSAIAALRDRYSMRSGLGSAPQLDWAILTVRGWTRLGGYYVVGYIGSLILVAAALGFTKRLRNDDRERGEGWPLVLGVALGSAAAFHLVLFNMSAIHSFSALKGGPAIALLVGLAAARLIDTWSRRRVAALSVGAAIVGIAAYLVWFTGPVPPYERVGGRIGAEAHADEVVFLSWPGAPDKLHPALILAAHRNVEQWTGPKAAQQLLARSASARGVRFIFDGRGRLLDVKRFATSSAPG
jgi:hypothetical protein